MKIKLVDGGFLYDKPVGLQSRQNSDGSYYCLGWLDEALKDPDCDGVDLTPFCNGRTLSEAQQETAEFIIENKRCFVFNGMGTGKTMSALCAMRAILNCLANSEWRALIISSKTVLSSAWLPEVQEVCPHIGMVIADGTPDRKNKILKDGTIRVVGVSADSLQHVPLDGFQIVIADEATLFKGAQGVGGTKRGSKMYELSASPYVHRLILMTGTPRAHSVMDAYGLYFTMNAPVREKIKEWNKDKENGGQPCPWRVMNKAEFRLSLCHSLSLQEYMILKGYAGTEAQWERYKGYGMSGVFADYSHAEIRAALDSSHRDATNSYIERKNANDTLMSLLSPAIAFRTEDILDLPDCPVIDYFLATSDEDKDKVKEMMRTMLMEFQDDRAIIANKMVLEGKMEQVNCGLVYDAEKNTRVFLDSNYNAAVKFILARIESAPVGRGIVISSRFNHILKAVEQILDIYFDSKMGVALINGATGLEYRKNAIMGFQSGELKVLLANTACLSHGVTLTNANEMILLDTPQYTEPYIQVKGRVHRRGQKWRIPIYRLIGNFIVARRYKILDGAQEKDDDFLKLMKGK